MNESKNRLNWKFWAVSGVLAAVAAVGVPYLALWRSSPSASAQESGPRREPTSAVRVEVVRPQQGGLQRITTQPGTVQAFESARLFAAVSGYLKTQKVDIGDRVKRGQVLATIEVPELDKQVEQYRAALEQSKAKESQMKAHLASARADLEAAKAHVVQAEAATKSAAAWCRFRDKQFKRRKDLFASRSIEEKLVEESMEQYEASVESERVAQAALVTARAQQVASEARIDRALADVVEAQAEAKVAQARLEKAQVMVQYATITSPYDGVITQRSLFPGDFVRAALGGGAETPLLTVERTDQFRVVVQIPDRDVPYTDPNDPAVVEIDALPGKQFPARVDRLARSEDPQTRLMRVEIDLANPTGQICQGMYGRVTIVLDQSPGKFSLPSSCLAGKSEDDRGSVYVVRNGIARLIPVKIGQDNGLQVAILDGLAETDRVILHPGNELSDGTPVEEIVPAASGEESHK